MQEERLFTQWETALARASFEVESRMATRRHLSMFLVRSGPCVDDDDSVVGWRDIDGFTRPTGRKRSGGTSGREAAIRLKTRFARCRITCGADEREWQKMSVLRRCILPPGAPSGA